MGNRKREGNEEGKSHDKRRGKSGRRKVWADWWRVREAEWMNEERGELSGDDLDMGENGMGLRQEQWEEIRNNKMRSESICKAEKM